MIIELEVDKKVLVNKLLDMGKPVALEGGIVIPIDAFLRETLTVGQYAGLKDFGITVKWRP